MRQFAVALMSHREPGLQWELKLSLTNWLTEKTGSHYLEGSPTFVAELPVPPAVAVRGLGVRAVLPRAGAVVPPVVAGPAPVAPVAVPPAVVVRELAVRAALPRADAVVPPVVAGPVAVVPAVVE